MRLAKRRHKEALDLLVKRVLPPVFGLARRFLGSTAEAEDAAQEVFVKVWKNLRHFKNGKKVKPWVLEITKNTCLDIIKKKRPAPFAAYENAAGENPFTETVIDQSQTPAQYAELSLSKILLNKAVKKLSVPYQKVIALYYHEGLNFREIAGRLNKSLDTVKSQHRRAIILLRQIMNGS